MAWPARVHGQTAGASDGPRSTLRSARDESGARPFLRQGEPVEEESVDGCGWDLAPSLPPCGHGRASRRELLVVASCSGAVIRRRQESSLRSPAAWWFGRRDARKGVSKIQRRLLRMVRSPGDDPDWGRIDRIRLLQFWPLPIRHRSSSASRVNLTRASRPDSSTGAHPRKTP